MDKITILYIEDDEKQRHEFTKLLEQRGFEVIEAGDGKSGIALFEEKNPEIVLCDLNMPALDGLGVLRHLKRIDPHTPVIILTGHGTIPDAVRTIKEGAYDFILKPLQIDEVEITLKKALEKISLEKKLEISEANLKLLIEYVPDIVYSLNPQGNFISVSQACEIVLGFKPSELIGTPVLDVIHPEDRERVGAGLAEVMKSGREEVRTSEFRMISKNGEVKHFEIKGRLAVENGRVIQNNGIARDITERKRLEKELQNYSQNLEKMVNDRTASLEYANHQLAALNDVSSKMTKTFSKDKLFDELPALLTNSLDFDRALLLLKENGELAVRSYRCEKDPTEIVEEFINRISNKKLRVPAKFQQSFDQNKTIFIPNIDAEPIWPADVHKALQTKALVVSPIRAKSRPIGIIVGSMQYHEREMNTQDVARFEMFANMVGITLDNIILYESLENLVAERTQSLVDANEKLDEKAKELQKATYMLGQANVELLASQEKLEEKNAEMEKLLDQLSRRTTELQSIIDTNPNTIIMVNTADKVIMANRSLTDFFGLKVDEILDQSYDLFLDKIKDQFEDFDQFLDVSKKLCVTRNDFEKEDFNYERIYKQSVKQIAPKERMVLPMSTPVLDADSNELGKIWIFSDITLLKKSYEQLHTIVNASPIPLIVSRVQDGAILFVNEHMAQLTGYDIHNLPSQKTPDFYFSASDREKIITMLTENGSVHNEEIRIKRSDGSAVWVTLSVELTEISDEQVAISGMFDINDRKMAEEALKRERNFVSAVLDTAGALVVVLDLSGKIVRFNNACEVITGYKSEEVLGKYFWDMFLVKEELGPVRAIFNSLVAGNFPNTNENCWLTKNGERRLISWANTALINDKNEIEYIISTGIDITETRATEEALQHSEQKYRELVEDSNSIMLRWDRQGNITFFNEYAQRFFGFPEAEIIGKNVVGTIVPDKDSYGIDLVGMMKDIEKHPEKYVSNENENIKSSGERVWITWANKPILDENGNLVEILSIGQDVTARKQAQEELKGAHKIYQAAIENVNGVPYLKNFETERYEFIGDGIKNLLGISSAELTLDKMKHFAKEIIITDPNAPATMEEYARAFLRGEVDHYRVDLRIESDSGEDKWISDCSVPVKDENTGRIIGSLGILQDVTERKRAEDRLRLYRKIFINSNDGIAIYNTRAEMVEQNPAHQKLYGYSDAEVKNQTASMIMGEEAATSIGQSLTTSGYFRGEITSFAKEGRQVNLDLSVFGILNESGDVTGYAGIGKDITQRKKDEEVLAARLRYEEGLAACSQVLLKETDTGPAIQEAMRQLLKAAGATRIYILENFMDEKDGLCMRELYEVISPRILSRFEDLQLDHLPYNRGFQRWEKTLSKGKPIQGFIESFPESERDVLAEQKIQSILVLPLWMNGAWFGVISFDDVEQKRAWNEEDIRLLQTAAEMIGLYLERKKVLEDLEKANHHLKETQSQLVQSEKMASLGSLVAGIAHEINTPIGAINSMHDTLMRAMEKLNITLKDDFPEAINENSRVKKALQIIAEANKVIDSGTSRVTNIVRRLRSFARLDEAELKTVDIHEGIEDTLTLIHHEIKHSVEIVRNYGAISPVACFPGQLNQVFLNLLMNAQQAIKDKGEVEITTSQRGNKVYVQIRDNGIGISKENLAKIFDPGFTTKGVGIGTGLGLSICYNIIQAHRGEIKVESESGKGTTFTVILLEDLDRILEREELQKEKK